MRIDLTTTKNVKLKTAGKYTEEDIEVVATLQTKQVRPTEESQVVRVDYGFSGLGEVQVSAIPNTYVGSAVPRKGETTYTPTTTDQEIGLGQFLSGKQVIKGDSNLVAENIAKGQTIFGITGTHEGGITPEGTMVIRENGVYDVTTIAEVDVQVEAQTSVSGNLTYYNAEIVAENGYNILKLTSSSTSGENIYAVGQVENNETLYLVRS